MITIPFSEQCATCDLGAPDNIYETFHSPTREQMTNLRQHVEARNGINLYIHRLNLHWFGTHGIGAIPLDY
jgi:hypothetical protein